MMKKQSLLSSLTAAALIIPALSQAMNEQDSQAIQTSEPKKKYDSILSSEAQCLDPRIKEIQDLKVVKIYSAPACTGEAAAAPIANPDAAVTIPTASESILDDGSATAPTASESILDDASATTPTASESILGDSASTAIPAGVQSEMGTTGAAADSATDPAYDSHAIFGENSKIFTRITRPVKNLFADVMLALTRVSHNNREYNLIPTRPDPMIQANSIIGYFEIPFTEKMDIKVSVGRDSVTSASPVYYTVTGASPGVVAPNLGYVQQAVTGASVRDQRNEGTVNINYYGEKITTRVEAGGSQENDYKSGFAGANLDIDLGGQNTMLSLGSSFTANTLSPNQLGAMMPRIGGKNTNWQLLAGMTQILNNTSLVQAAVTRFLDQGYMNDPYKPDYLPDKRQGWAFAGRYLHYIPSFHEAGLDLSYRYYTDSWAVNSSTFKGSLRMAMANGWALEPGVRYYSQNGTKYYNLLTPPNVTPQSTFLYYTSDYRFASYGQVSALLEVDKQISLANTVYVGGELGTRNASLRLGGTKITYPGEPEFTKITLASVYIGIKGVY